MAIKKNEVNNSPRIIENKKIDIDFGENSLRPQTLAWYVWQENIKKHLSVCISRALIRKQTLEHILFYWPPWLWKTTISNILSYEMWSNLKISSWPAIEKQSDIISILSNLETWDILFIDEIHRLKPQIEEVLYTAMEDFVIDIMVWKWTWAQSVRMPVNSFTLLGATTKLSSLSNPLRDRFGNILKLDFYSIWDIEKILNRNSINLGLDLWTELIKNIRLRSRWTPRIANRILKIIRDYYTIWKEVNKEEIYIEIFNDLWIDNFWLDYLDRKYLETIEFKFAWWPVGLNTISQAVWEEELTIEDVVEPYLLQIWFIQKTSRWRALTDLWSKHINKNRILN